MSPHRTPENVLKSSGEVLEVWLQNPKETDQKGEKALVFEVALVTGTGVRLLTMRGWRVWRGIVQPPATRGTAGRYFPTVTVDSEGLQGVLEQQVQQWAPQWPQVQFPGLEGPERT